MKERLWTSAGCHRVPGWAWSGLERHDVPLTWQLGRLRDQGGGLRGAGEPRGSPPAAVSMPWGLAAG